SMKFADLVRLEQSGIRNQHDLHAEPDAMTYKFEKIRVQRGLPPGEQQVSDSLAIHDVHGINGALPVGVFPVGLPQAVTREVAESAVSVASVVDRELAKTRAALVKHEPHGIEPRLFLCRS